MTSPDVTLRPAEVVDDAALATIDRATWSPTVTPAAKPDPGSPFARDPKRLENVLIAEVEGLVAGYVAVQQSMALPSHAHVLEINGLAVDPRWQGRGLGRILVEEAKRVAARKGARKLTLRVLAPNLPARSLYESCGFTVEGVLQGEFLLDDQLVDDVLMACRLGAAGVTPRRAPS